MLQWELRGHELLRLLGSTTTIGNERAAPVKSGEGATKAESIKRGLATLVPDEVGLLDTAPLEQITSDFVSISKAAGLQVQVRFRLLRRLCTASKAHLTRVLLNRIRQLNRSQPPSRLTCLSRQLRGRRKNPPSCRSIEKLEKQVQKPSFTTRLTRRTTLTKRRATRTEM